ncbi:MAG: hypothetical protein WB341_05855 [Terracidiphilus sp.]
MNGDDPKFGWRTMLVRACRAVKLWSLRTIAIAGAAITIWIVVGSIAYPAWWCAAIWGGGLFNRKFVIGDSDPFVQGGLIYLLEAQPWVLFGVAGLILALTAVTAFLPALLKKCLLMVDRWAMRVILVCIAAQFANTVLLFRQVGSIDADAWMDSMVTPLEPPPPFEARAPIDFYYLDQDHVDADYSEIEPELIEERRLLSTENKVGGNAGINAGGASVSGEASRTGKDVHEFERSAFSSARKCIDPMNYALRHVPPTISRRSMSSTNKAPSSKPRGAVGSAQAGPG